MAKAVYLVHYKQPRGHVRHAVRTVQATAEAIRHLYRQLDKLPIDHRAKAQGIAFVLVRTWAGRDGGFERKLKDQKHHSRLCPFCNPTGHAQRTTRMR